jgi:diadenosine tetraphosphate (Ap4A) HIT family hydrolase
MLERLWNGWRSSYVSGLTEPAAPGIESVFTQILHSGLPDEATHILRRGEHCFAILNAYPYATGHLLVLPYREVANLEDLTTEETEELWAMSTAAVVALKAAYAPEGINLGLNLGKPAGGSVSQHLHVHVVPRWTGDSNFMTTVANTRTLPEALEVTADRIRSRWL